MTSPRSTEAPLAEAPPAARARRLIERGRRHEVLLGAGGAVMAISMMAHFRVPILPDIGRDLSLSAFELGLITTAFAAGRLIFDIPTGSMADRLSPRTMFSAAAIALGLGSFTMAVAPIGSVTLIAGFVLGVSTAIANTTGMTLFATSVAARNRGAAMAGFSASLLGGQALGPAIAGAISAVGGWRGTMVAAGVGAFALMLLLRLVRRVRSPERTVARPDDDGGESGGVEIRVGSIQRMVLYSVPFAMFFTLGSMPQTLIPIIGSGTYGFSAAVIGLALGLGGFCRFVGAMVGGLISDRISRKAALLPGLALMALGVALLALDIGAWAWVASIVVMSLGSFGVSVAATMLADHARGQRVGRRLGPFRFVGDLGLVSGPMVTTAIFATAGRQAAVLSVAGLLTVCTILCALVLHETRRARDEMA